MAREDREKVYKLVSCVVLLGKHPSYNFFSVHTRSVVKPVNK